MFKAILGLTVVGVLASALTFEMSDNTEFKDYAERHHANQESLNQLESSQKYISEEMAVHFEACLNDASKTEILTVKKVRRCTLYSGRARLENQLDNLMTSVLN